MRVRSCIAANRSLDDREPGSIRDPRRIDGVGRVRARPGALVTPEILARRSCTCLLRRKERDAGRALPPHRHCIYYDVLTHN